MMERSKFIPDFEKKPRREAVHGRQLRSRDDLPDEVHYHCTPHTNQHVFLLVFRCSSRVVV